jgi:two-component sensor histidine kinase
MQGPIVRVSPHDAQAIGMTIHELTTNAAKYGALATAGGSIDISWRIEVRNNQQHLQLDWRERGVTIENIRPSKGFGTRVITETLPHMLGGTVELELERHGAVCRIDCPLQR